MTDVEKIPSREFLSMVVIMLRKSHKETGMNLLEWLEYFEEIDPELDAYDDKQLKAAVSKMLNEAYPDPMRPLNPDDIIDAEEEESLPQVEKLDEPDTVDPHADAIEGELVEDDEDDLPIVQKLDD